MGISEMGTGYLVVLCICGPAWPAYLPAMGDEDGICRLADYLLPGALAKRAPFGPQLSPDWRLLG